MLDDIDPSSHGRIEARSYRNQYCDYRRNTRTLQLSHDQAIHARKREKEAQRVRSDGREERGHNLVTKSKTAGRASCRK